MSHDYYHEFHRDSDGKVYFVAEDVNDEPEFSGDEPSLTFSNVRGVGGPFPSLDRAIEAMKQAFGTPLFLEGVKESEDYDITLRTIKRLADQSPSFVATRNLNFKDEWWATFDTRKNEDEPTFGI